MHLEKKELHTGELNVIICIKGELMSIIKSGKQFIKNLFNNKIDASSLNNYRRSCNSHYDDVCM